MNSRRGQALVEVILAMGLAAVLLPALITGLVASREGRAQQTQRGSAVALAREGLDAVRTIREGGWEALAQNGTYYPAIAGGTWELADGVETTAEGYTRSIEVSDVLRDATGAIVEAGGVIDPSTKRVEVAVGWTTPSVSEIRMVTYVTRYLDNITVGDSSVTDFEGGTLVDTAVTNTLGGEVQLGAGGAADWCEPTESVITTLTLPKRGNAIAAIPNEAYVGTGDGTQGVTFAQVNIDNPLPPGVPAAAVTGTYESSYKTNAVYSLDGYAYLATDGSSSQVVILDISQVPFTQVGWIDVPGGAAANGVYVAGNVAYVTSGRRLYTFDVTNKNGAHSTALGSISVWIGLFSPQARQVVVVGNYAYVGTANTLFGLQKFKVSNGGATLKLVGVSNLTWQQAAQGLAVSSDGRRAYVAFNEGSFFAKGFFIVNTSPPDPPSWWILPNFYGIVGYFNAGNTDPRGMAVVPGNRAIVVGTGGTQQYQVIDITNEGSPQLCGGMAVESGVTGVASIVELDGDAFSYIITGEERDQFKVIQGGVGGGQFATAGTYESQTFDAGYTTAFNRVTANVAEPESTEIKLQVGIEPGTAGCGGVTFTFVGPDGTSGSYFEPVGASVSGVIPFGVVPPSYTNPGRCMRYKAFLSTTNQNSTPILYDVAVNYSP